MQRISFLALTILALATVAKPAQAEGPHAIAAGDWSKPVADKYGYALRGRLVLCEKVVADDRREVAVYIELQDASHFAGGDGVQLYCELSKHDFRPEYKGGLHCEMRDGKGNAIEPQGFSFGGMVPRNQWVTLPTDATIRLRTTPFGIHRQGAMAICPDISGMWIIPDDDKNEYRLSGTFTIDPAAENKPPSADPHIWHGTLELPAMQIFSRGMAARAQ